MTSTLTSNSKRVDAALLILRTAVGVIFLVHGAQKLIVYGLPNISSGFAQYGIPFPEIAAPLVAFVEFLGGIALIFGLLTRIASLALAIDMLGTIYFVHFQSGFFLPNGYEFVLSLFAASVAFVLAGAGAWSVDAWLAGRRWRTLGGSRQVQVRTGPPHPA